MTRLSDRPDRPDRPTPVAASFPLVVRDEAGTRRLVGRRLGQLTGTVVTCPDGRRAGRCMRPGDHHVALECVHVRGDSRAGRIGEDVHWLYLLPAAQGPPNGPPGGTLVVECTADEVRVIVERRLTLAEIRAYLAIEHAVAA